MAHKHRFDGVWHKNAAGIYVQAEPISKTLVAAAATNAIPRVKSDNTLEFATLTAGTDITITHGAGTVTIASTASDGGGGGGVTELSVTNPGAEAGDTTGWTAVGGGFTSEAADPSGHDVTPVEGSRCFVASANADPSQYQDVSVSTHSTAIDSGAVVGGFTVAAAPTHTSPEDIIASLTALDNSSVSLGIAQVHVPRVGGTADVWYRLDARMVLPVGTRSLRLTMRSFRLSGTNNNAAFDDARAYLIGA